MVNISAGISHTYRYKNTTLFAYMQIMLYKDIVFYAEYWLEADGLLSAATEGVIERDHGLEQGHAVADTGELGRQ